MATPLSFADMHNPKKIDFKKADQYIMASMGVAIFMFIVNLLIGYYADAVIAGLLAFGLYKKNFPAAVILSIYFLASKIYIFSAGGVAAGTVVFSAGLFYLTVLGAIGTYKYKTEKKTKK